MDVYQERKLQRQRINEVLLPLDARVSYVGFLNGAIMVIWYFGKAETGFARATTENGVIDRILEQVCRGL